ncbi:MAG: hypothetical protein K0R38_4081 [Polyangiaceae bacterium]|jgi:hypothetical protein|nr:hypothetical protein [Polyangiaceae bacterium]
MIRVGHRFMTGQICGTTGDYEFDGYVDMSSTPLLTEEQRRLTFQAGSPFPTASDLNKRAYFKFVGWV